MFQAQRRIFSAFKRHKAVSAENLYTDTFRLKKVIEKGLTSQEPAESVAVPDPAERENQKKGRRWGRMG